MHSTITRILVSLLLRHITRKTAPRFSRMLVRRLTRLTDKSATDLDDQLLELFTRFLNLPENNDKDS